MLAAELENACLIVAHPDDEILWFSSVVERVKRLIIVFGKAPGQKEWTEGRRKAIEAYPLKNLTFLNFTESMCFMGANWNDPVESTEGLRVTRSSRSLEGFDKAQYHSNFTRLVATLPTLLSDVSHVITHNPWGEYGHEEHVQVYRAVQSLQQTLKFKLWFDNYCSDRSSVLMRRYLNGSRRPAEIFPTNRRLALDIEKLYRHNNCWTWPFNEFEYFATEQMLLQDQWASTGRPLGAGTQLNYIDVDAGVLKEDRAIRLLRKVRHLRARMSL